MQTTLEKLNRETRDLLGLRTPEPDRSIPTPEELRALAGYPVARHSDDETQPDSTLESRAT